MSQMEERPFLMKEHAYLTKICSYMEQAPAGAGKTLITPIRVADLAAAVDGANGIECNYSTSSQGQHVSSIYATKLEINGTHGEFHTCAGGDEKLKKYFAWFYQHIYCKHTNFHGHNISWIKFSRGLIFVGLKQPTVIAVANSSYVQSFVGLIFVGMISHEN